MSDTSDTKRMKPKDVLRRKERIQERDPLAKFPDYDVDKAMAREKMEIKTNPRGFERRHRNEGLDKGTQAELDAARKARRRRGRRG